MTIGSNLVYFTVPLTSALATLAVLLPYWWSSDTFHIGLWRARSSISSSSWIIVEPQLDNHEGRYLFALQILSIFAVLLSDLQGLLWIILLLKRQTSSFIFLMVSLFIMTIITYSSLSILVILVWQTTLHYLHLIRISYSFYIVLVMLVIHSLTLISILINFLQYQRERHSIKPVEKIQQAFYQIDA